jgi:N-acetylglucosaminyl-diphospho-decaprenol L-rhamnosyltransferase
LGEGMPTYDIVITHYHDPGALMRCVESVYHHPHRGSLTVVSGAEDGSVARAALNGFPGTTLISFRANVGYATLVNAGILSGAAPYVLVLNADTEIASSDAEALARYLDRCVDVGLVGPRLYGAEGYQPSAFRYYRLRTLLFRRTPLGRARFAARELSDFTYQDELVGTPDSWNDLDVDWLMGAVLMVRRSALPHVGLLDSRYWMYFEDVDWCWRFWRSGWRVRYEPAAQAFHRHGGGSRVSRNFIVEAIRSPLLRAHLRSAAIFLRRYRNQKAETELVVHAEEIQ